MSFSKEIIKWYLQNKRDLPWRKTKNPYKIWLSEVILQQTKVVQGLSYYLKFTTHFPTVSSLAKAEEEEILKLWQGLGYYSRARNLHFAAKQIITEFSGIFPTNYTNILKLKGVGDYTASAISSFCFEEKQAVVDGNVYRVLSRYFGVTEAIDTARGKKKFKMLADELLNKDAPGLHNQAIMEFGALQCVPKNPKCDFCPLNISCFAFSHTMVDSLPRKDKKLKQRHRYFNYLVVKKDNYIYIDQRQGKDIWENMYQFPLIETEKEMPIDHLTQTKLWENIFNKTSYAITRTHTEVKYILSHQIINTKFIEIELASLDRFNYLKINVNQLENYPVPTLISNFIKKSLINEPV